VRTTLLRGIVSLALILSQLGCRSVYRFHCTSYPSEAGGLVADEMMGETPCDVEIPKDSDAIQDGKVDVNFEESQDEQAPAVPVSHEAANDAHP